ncbi:lytic murein transglycosylase [Pseudahrensia aquimaris]|uniref:Lytic murein transglycosylase n=1 Tax=Pseudahrensia aquimaris TaxID=744461 RepID=A0ABW3FDJ5_9HYPH
MTFTQGLRTFVAAAVAGASLAVMTLPASADAGFRKWVNQFENVAAKNGIKRSVYRRAFKGVTAPDPEVIQLTRFQPEFKQEMWQYFDSRVNENSIARGKEMNAKWDRWLTELQRKYGVSRYILLAIWSMETSYGKALEKDRAMRSVVRSLATLGYKDRRRRKFARSQLIGALKMVQRGDVSMQNLRGSWAGAMGHTQFIPTSYLAYRQDVDGDGRADIWNSIPDALATAANLLRRNGWRTGQTWGYEVNIPRSVRRQAGKTRTVSQWAKLGVKRVKGKRFKRGNVRATLKLPAGANGPAFLMTKNFFVIKRYNNADKYALAVGHLADQIAGYGDFANQLPRPYRRLSEDERILLQQRLAQLGLYDGEIDGKIGSGTRAAIRKAQDRLGMRPDGYESPKLLQRLNRNG